MKHALHNEQLQEVSSVRRVGIGRLGLFRELESTCTLGKDRKGRNELLIHEGAKEVKVKV